MPFFAVDGGRKTVNHPVTPQRLAEPADQSMTAANRNKAAMEEARPPANQAPARAKPPPQNAPEEPSKQAVLIPGNKAVFSTICCCICICTVSVYVPVYVYVCIRTQYVYVYVCTYMYMYGVSSLRFKKN